MARWLKPDLMIESGGAFKGHSTWVLRKAMPITRIISPPTHPEKYLKKGPAYLIETALTSMGRILLILEALIGEDY